MKKILLLLILLVFVGSTNAATIQITKLTAMVKSKFDGNTYYKDSIVKNNGTLTENLFPLSGIVLNVKWKNFLSIGAPYEWTVYFNIHQYANNHDLIIQKIPHMIVDSDVLDSTLINVSPNIYTIGYETLKYKYGYKIVVTYFDDDNIERVITESNLTSFSIIEDPNKISDNSICCSQLVKFPFTAVDSLKQSDNTFIHTNGNSKIEYIWQQLYINGNWVTINGATNAKYLPPKLSKNTIYRRVAIVNRGLLTESYNISNEVSFGQYVCGYPDPSTNTICNDQAYFDLIDGDIIYPSYIRGSAIKPGRDRDKIFDYYRSLDRGITWNIVKAGEIYGNGYNLDNYEIPPITFDISKGAVQEILYSRNFYEYYDPWDCGPGKLPVPCGKKPIYVSTSNIVTITLTSLGGPKDVVDSITNETGYDTATCSYSSQTMTFSVPRVNNSETYKWEIPTGWIANTDLQGPYANSITISTNSGGANYAKGGNVCVTIKQPGQINSMCRHIQGSKPFTVKLPAVLTGCEGSNVIVKPVILQNNVVKSSEDYTFNWEAYQSPNKECIPQIANYNDNCEQLKINISNVYENPVQPIKVIAYNKNGCIATATTTLTTVPGLQMGILNSFADPKASSTSNLALNESSNHLYFAAANNVIQRAYFDNNTGYNIWRYTELKDKNTNFSITAMGSVAFYRDAVTISDKLFYVNAGNIYYAETTDNGLTWTNYNSVAIATGVNRRIKISGDNLYYIDGTGKVFYKSLINAAFPVLVGSVAINYSQDMFTVEEGILAYADQSNSIVAFNALTGAVLPINVATNIKAVAYNSTISIYNKNIYYVSNSGNSGTLRILQKSATSTSYTASQDVANQLAGPFTINKQTGTVYAKTYDVPGKQIYYLNNQWTITSIKNYLQGSPIQSSMIYGNGHAYYIGTNGLISNTFYIAPCIPNVLRTSGSTFASNGDAPNDPIPVMAEAIDILALYPNPTKDLVHVTVTLENTSSVQIKIITLAGVEEVVLDENIEEGSHDIELALSKYTAGVYIVQLYVNDALTASSKLIKY